MSVFSVSDSLFPSSQPHDSRAFQLEQGRSNSYRQCFQLLGSRVARQIPDLSHELQHRIIYRASDDSYCDLSASTDDAVQGLLSGRIRDFCAVDMGHLKIVYFG
jgi:hypothetical protein